MKKFLFLLILISPSSAFAFDATPLYFTATTDNINITISGASDWCSFNSDGTPQNHANGNYNLPVRPDLTKVGGYTPNFWIVFSNDDCTGNGDYESEILDPDFLGSFCIGENEICSEPEPDPEPFEIATGTPMQAETYGTILFVFAISTVLYTTFFLVRRFRS